MRETGKAPAEHRRMAPSQQGLEKVARMASSAEASGDNVLATQLFKEVGERHMLLGNVDHAITHYDSAVRNAGLATGSGNVAQHRENHRSLRATLADLRETRNREIAQAADMARREAMLEARRMEIERRWRSTRQDHLRAQQRLEEDISRQEDIAKTSSRLAMMNGAFTAVLAGFDVYVSNRVGGIPHYFALVASSAATAIPAYFAGLHSFIVLEAKHFGSKFRKQLEKKVSPEINERIESRKQVIESGSRRAIAYGASTAILAGLDLYITKGVGGALHYPALALSIAATGLSTTLAAVKGYVVRSAKRAISKLSSQAQ